MTVSLEIVRERLRAVPKVDVLARQPSLARFRERLGEAGVMHACRSVIAEVRCRVMDGADMPSLEAAALAVAARLEPVLSARVRRVINGTGVLLHTNLGRAPLSLAAVKAAAEAGRGYESLELDLEAGGRGSRGAYAERALAELTGAEAALVVNNNAAAVLLVLTAMAYGRGVLVSRGELVEIGGGFRVPEVLERSGAHMVEVGTTNRTRLADYERALDEHDDIAVILTVHPGNFRINGFTEAPMLKDLAALARRRGLTHVDDLGGGALIDLEAHAGLAGEPTAADRVAAGVHATCFSCDKVLGGPQGGAIVGERAVIDRVRRDPLARALRLGPMPTAALEATLEHYLARDMEAVPVLAMMRRPVAEVARRAERWSTWLAAKEVRCRVVSTEGRVGGGTFAEEPLPSAALELEADGHTAVSLAARLRSGPTAVLPRIASDRVLVDARTVLDDEEDALLEAVVAACRSNLAV